MISMLRPVQHDNMLTNYRDRYSNRAEIFKRPENRKDSSDLDEHLTESIAAMKTFISKNFVAAGLQKNCFKEFRRESRCLNIYRCSFTPSIDRKRKEADHVKMGA